MVIGYAPFHGFVFKCTYSEKKLLENCDFKALDQNLKNQLVCSGVLVKKGLVTEEKIHNKENKRNVFIVTILMTSECNMECIYCYAKNEFKHTINIDTFKETIIEVFEYCKNNFIGVIHFKIHGLGEPTVSSNDLFMMVDCVKKFSFAYKIKHNFSITTNGFFGEDLRGFLCDNFKSITISYDGLPSLNNKNRLAISGENSSDLVLRNIKYFVCKEKDVKIRTTVVGTDTYLLPDIVSFLSDLGIKTVYVEPVAATGAAIGKSLLVNPHDFAKYYLKAKRKASELGVSLNYSGGTIKRITMRHCGAYGNNFVITPLGKISLCYEVHMDSQNLTEKLLFKNFQEWLLATSKNLINEIDGECINCFARYNCGGGCLVRRLSKNQETIEGFRGRCEITKVIIKNELVNLLKIKENKYLYID